MPGQYPPSITGYDPSGTVYGAGFTGPIPWGPNELRTAALKAAGPYLSCYWDEQQGADGAGNTAMDNVRAFTKFRIKPKITTQTLTPLSELRNGSNASPTDGGLSPSVNYIGNTTRNIILDSSALGLTTIYSPSAFYITPMANYKAYGGAADDSSVAQGSADAGVPLCVSGFWTYGIESAINTVKTNVNYWPYYSLDLSGNKASPKIDASSGYYSKGTQDAPFSMWQMYVTSDDEVNRSLISRAKGSGYSVGMLTIDAANGQVADRIYQMSGTIFNSSYALGTLASDPVANYKCWITSPFFPFTGGVQCVASTDPAVLAYCSAKTGVPISTLQAAYNAKASNSFLATLILNGVKLTNNITDSSNTSYKFSIKNIVSYFHQNTPLKDNANVTLSDPSGIPLPIIIKGINQTIEAQSAIDADADGIIVSNHGGRIVDNGRAAIDVLPIVKSYVKAARPNMGVWFDSGIRRGQDIAFAYALGAEFVGVGRPVVCANVAGGRVGVRQVLQQLIYTLRKTMLAAGLNNLNHPELNPLMLEQRTETITDGSGHQSIVATEHTVFN